MTSVKERISVVAAYRTAIHNQSDTAQETQKEFAVFGTYKVDMAHVKALCDANGELEQWRHELNEKHLLNPEQNPRPRWKNLGVGESASIYCIFGIPQRGGWKATFYNNVDALDQVTVTINDVRAFTRDTGIDPDKETEIFEKIENLTKTNPSEIQASSLKIHRGKDGKVSFSGLSGIVEDSKTRKSMTYNDVMDLFDEMDIPEEDREKEIKTLAETMDITEWPKKVLPDEAYQKAKSALIDNPDILAKFEAEYCSESQNNVQDIALDNTSKIMLTNDEYNSKFEQLEEMAKLIGDESYLMAFANEYTCPDIQ